MVVVVPGGKRRWIYNTPYVLIHPPYYAISYQRALLGDIIQAIRMFDVMVTGGDCLWRG